MTTASSTPNRALCACSLLVAVACGPSAGVVSGGVDGTGDDGAVSSSEGASGSEDGRLDSADTTAGDGSTDDSTDGSTGQTEVVPCFVRTSQLTAHSAAPITFDDDAAADLATSGITLLEQAPLQIFRNDGDVWTEAEVVELQEFDGWRLLDVDLDGLTDVVVEPAQGAPIVLRNGGGVLEPPSALDPALVDAVLVDYDADGRPDPIRRQGQALEVLHRNSDGSGTLVGTVDVAPPDASGLPQGEDCDPGWQLIAVKPSANTPHIARSFSHCCEDGCTQIVDVVVLAPDGMASPVVEVPTDVHWLGDLDADGELDLIDRFGRFSRLEAGALVERFDLDTASWRVGDLEPDGILDVVVALDGGETDEPTAAVMLGADDWTEQHIVEGGRPEAIADFDGDGDGDLLIHEWLVGTPFVLSFDWCPA